MDRIGPYELLDEIGSGGFGRVYRARHSELGWIRAVKVATDPEFVRQLRKEGLVLARLRHPHIVEVHDMNTSHDPPYIVMEYVEGEDLRKRLDRGALPVGGAVQIALDVLEALEHAHGQGVIHRDIKPSNILLDKDGRAKVSDFGLGRIVEEASMSWGRVQSMRSGSSDISGTLKYMSPEQLDPSLLEGEELDGRSDLYSLGLVFYEMLTGEFPTGLRPPMPSQVSPQVPPALDELFIRCTVGRPGRRFAGAREVIASIHSTCEGGYFGAPPQSSPPSAPRQPPPPHAEHSQAPASTTVANGAGALQYFLTDVEPPVLVSGAAFVILSILSLGIYGIARLACALATHQDRDKRLFERIARTLTATHVAAEGTAMSGPPQEVPALLPRRPTRWLAILVGLAVGGATLFGITSAINPRNSLVDRYNVRNVWDDGRNSYPRGRSGAGWRTEWTRDAPGSMAFSALAGAGIGLGACYPLFVLVSCVRLGFWFGHHEVWHRSLASFVATKIALDHQWPDRFVRRRGVWSLERSISVNVGWVLMSLAGGLVLPLAIWVSVLLRCLAEHRGVQRAWEEDLQRCLGGPI